MAERVGFVPLTSHSINDLQEFLFTKTARSERKARSRYILSTAQPLATLHLSRGKRGQVSFGAGRKMRTVDAKRGERSSMSSAPLDPIITTFRHANGRRVL